jgi:hypothetical protein
MITNARKVLNASSANQNHGVLLQVMPNAGNVSGYFYPIGEADAGNLAQSRVRLLWRNGVNTRTDAAALRILLKGRRSRTGPLVFASMSNKLLNAWQNYFLLPA